MNVSHIDAACACRMHDDAEGEADFALRMANLPERHPMSRKKTILTALTGNLRTSINPDFGADSRAAFPRRCLSLGSVGVTA